MAGRETDGNNNSLELSEEDERRESEWEEMGCSKAKKAKSRREREIHLAQMDRKAREEKTPSGQIAKRYLMTPAIIKTMTIAWRET
ncbi:hypothetical protein SKAU_G00137180 [Synaphobranchus kaupii]|uniref:Uncharacterized protein n=1 Tax=Synaphobranchus kaupii TaxID=118154 RepID=A0A9Q1FSK5_SYNKA|nr:hypothetical protein SKAU_G00137180 [Synaphobranchus kaupii]